VAEEVNQIQTFLRIVQSLKDDGSLEREDWLLLLPLFIRLTQKLRDSIEGRPFLIIALAGVEKVLDEVLEHVEELPHGLD
tara:strand:+ start:788 stop:1027 length:240 start_codon:yes stop_codon:yes gene_type:complete